jgi:hypothetical protein
LKVYVRSAPWASLLFLIVKDLNKINLLNNISANMGGVASIPQDRTRSLQAIGAGYSRTGTLSIALAFEKLLDGPVMHGGSQLLGREDGTPLYTTPTHPTSHTPNTSQPT